MAAGVLASGYESEKNISWRDIVDDIRDKWTELCGHDMEAGFSNETYESEKATAYNNFAIGELSRLKFLSLSIFIFAVQENSSNNVVYCFVFIWCIIFSL